MESAQNDHASMVHSVLKHKQVRDKREGIDCLQKKRGCIERMKKRKDNEDEDDDVYNICLFDASHVCLIILHFTTYPKAVLFNGFRSRSTDITLSYKLWFPHHN